MEILIPITMFAMIAAIVVLPRWFKSQERQKLQETLRASIEKGAALPPEVIDALTSDVKAPPSPYKDLRSGIIWLGVAVGFASLGFAVSFEEPDAFYPLLGIAAFPGFIGLALIALSFVTRGKQ
ncbi:DUF6249 domain-containing protein [Phenylobacterium sp.]|uniref:DUF6249 domain-containing protein n=1 Tax=Phenylobacterium sp. TaxID=1871053 RepID=UPI00286A1FE7|nr:DUF6249 domain-containing protein [Phenylobacterium sp.]